jgi:hypothetical protein
LGTVVQVLGTEHAWVVGCGPWGKGIAELAAEQQKSSRHSRHSRKTTTVKLHGPDKQASKQAGKLGKRKKHRRRIIAAGFTTSFSVVRTADCAAKGSSHAICLPTVANRRLESFIIDYRTIVLLFCTGPTGTVAAWICTAEYRKNVEKGKTGRGRMLRCGFSPPLGNLRDDHHTKHIPCIHTDKQRKNCAVLRCSFRARPPPASAGGHCHAGKHARTARKPDPYLVLTVLVSRCTSVRR